MCKQHEQSTKTININKQHQHLTWASTQTTKSNTININNIDQEPILLTNIINQYKEPLLATSMNNQNQLLT